jgi:hypothetical protein
MVEEARLEQLDAGLTPVSDGWFVVRAKGMAGEGHVYPRSELALRHGAGVEEETTSPEAYAPFPKWKPGPPHDWDALPWA